MIKPMMLSMALLLVLCGSGNASADENFAYGIGPAPVSLGSAGTFTILSKTGITDV